MPPPSTPPVEELLNPAHGRRRTLRILLWMLGWLTAVFVIASLIFNAVMLPAVLAQSEQLVRIASSNEALNRRMLDCTQPTGTCYREGQSRTGAAIATINEVTVAAAFCAKTLPPSASLAALRECIQRQAPH